MALLTVLSGGSEGRFEFDAWKGGEYGAGCTMCLRLGERSRLTCPLEAKLPFWTDCVDILRSEYSMRVAPSDCSASEAS